METRVQLILYDGIINDITLDTLQQHFGLFELMGNGVIITNNLIDLSQLPISKASVYILIAFNTYGDLCIDQDVLKDKPHMPTHNELIQASMCLDFLEDAYRLHEFIDNGHFYNRQSMYNVCPAMFFATVFESRIRREIALGEKALLHGLIELNYDIDKSWHQKQNRLPDNAPRLFEQIADNNNHITYDDNPMTSILSKVVCLGNVCVAGGAVLQMFQGSFSTHNLKTYQPPVPPGDIDVFVWGLTEKEANAKVKQIIKTLKTFKVRSCNFTGNAYTCILGKGIVLQVVCRLYGSPSEIIHGFDIQACKVLMLYDHEHKCNRIYGTQTFVESLRYRTVWVDTERQSSTYAIRLVKYFCKGFDVIVPGLERRRIDCEIMSVGMKDLKGLALLMRLEREIRARIVRMWKPQWTRHQVKRVLLRVIKAEALLRSDYDDDTLFDTNTYFHPGSWNTVNYLFKYTRQLYDTSFVKQIWQNIMSNYRGNSKNFVANAEWVTRDPSSQTVSGCFHPENEQYYHTAYGIKVGDDWM